MKTISIYEFKKLIARDDWQREQEHEILDSLVIETEEWINENEGLGLIETNKIMGSACKTSTLLGVKINYNEGFSYNEFDSSSLTYGTEGLFEVWCIEGITVVDEDGDTLDVYDLAEHLDLNFSCIDYSWLEIANRRDKS